MASALCLQRIAAQKPPLDRECPVVNGRSICSDENFVNGTHCKQLGIDPDVPFSVKDPNANGPGKPGWCSCCCSCMSRDTPLEQTPGEFVLVQDVNPGDTLLVAGSDLKWRPGVVKLRSGDTTPLTYQGMYLVIYKFEEEETTRFLLVTPDHLFMQAEDRRLKAIQHLVPGDALLRNDGRAASVVFVAPGSYHTEIHTIEMEGNFDGKNLDGHLLNANGLVTTDYQVQAFYAAQQIKPHLLFEPKEGGPALEVGEADYEERFPSKERDAFLGDPSAWPKGFVPRLKDSLFNIPADAKGFVINPEAEQILANGQFVPLSDHSSQYTIYKLFGYMRAVYPRTVYVLDWNNELPNAYSWTQAGQRFVVVTGGLARFVGLFSEGFSLILASVQARLDGAECIGDADYQAAAYGLRKVWPDDMIPAVSTSAIEQVAALFKCITEQTPTDVCEAPTTKCRLETFESGLGFGGVPDCAKPVVVTFELVSAQARMRVRGTEVVATFNLPCEVVTATTADNYTFTPPLKIVSAKMDRKPADGTRVVLTVKGLKPKGIYTLTATNVLSATGLPLSPQHRTVQVQRGK